MASKKIYLQLDPKKDITSEPVIFSGEIHLGKIPLGKNKIQFEKKMLLKKYIFTA